MRLLDAGVTVSRTADDFVRYHGKMMVVDGKALHVFGFNLTRLDIEKSRSFGLVTRKQKPGAGGNRSCSRPTSTVSRISPATIASSSVPRTPGSG